MAAKPFFVAIITIELLNSRMGVKTSIPIRAFLLSFDVRTEVARVMIAVPFTIFGIVVVHAVFVVMSFGDIARVQLKDVQV